MGITSGDNEVPMELEGQNEAGQEETVPELAEKMEEDVKSLEEDVKSLEEGEEYTKHTI